MLAGTDTLYNSMHAFEQLYLDVLDSVDLAGWSGFNCRYFTQDTITNCPIKTDSTDVVGFMWFNYSLLNNPNRSPVEYQRNLVQEELITENKIWFDAQTHKICILIANQTADKKQLQLFDSRGRFIHEQSILTQNSFFDCNQLKPGFYLASLRDGTQQISLKFVKTTP